MGQTKDGKLHTRLLPAHEVMLKHEADMLQAAAVFRLSTGDFYT